MKRQFSLILPIIVYLLSHLAGASTNELVLFNRKLYVRPSVTAPPLPVTAGTNNNDPVKDVYHPIGSCKPSLQRSTVCVKPAITSRKVAKTVLLSAAALRLSPFGNSLSTRGIAASLLLFATPAYAGWGGQCASGYLGVSCSTNDCCWGAYDSSSNTCSGTHTTVCNGTPNSNIIGCGACCGYQTCDGLDSSTIIGPSSCHGYQACKNIKGSVAQQSCVGTFSCESLQGSVGQQSCVGYDSCNDFQGSVGQHSCLADYGCDLYERPSDSITTIGDNSCNTYQGCYKAYGSTIGSNSCNGGLNIKSCWHCQNSNIPSNECNSLKNGWYDYNNYYSYCIFCSNCKDEVTGQSCYVSVLSSTVRATPSSTNENDTDCKKLNQTITEAFKAIKNETLKELIGKYAKSEIEEQQNLCTIKLALMFEHLNKDKLERTCEVLQTFFSNQVEEFKKNHPRFTEMIFSCEPKDQNANVGKDPKKSKNSKNTKKSKKNGKKENKRIRKHSKALVAQFDGA